MIEKWYTDTFTIYRQQQITDDSGNVIGTEEGEIGDITGNLQQMDAEKAEAREMTFSKAFVFYTKPEEDIKEGDKLVRDSEEFNVSGKEIFKHPRMNNDHLRVILSR